MKIRLFTLLAVLFTFLATNHLEAQDIHFSQYYASPLTLNPALTGKFDGLWRVNAIYRDQYRNAVSNNPLPYMTPSFSVDFSLLKNKLKTDALGVGAMVFYDKVGGLNTLKAGLSLAYHKGLDKNNRYHLALGLQGVYGNRQINGDYLFEEDILSGGLPGYDDMNLTNQKAVNSVDMTAGALFDAKFTDWMTFYAGYSFFNVLRHKDDFITTKDNQTPFRHVAHGGFEFEIKKKWLILPGALYQTTVKTKEINFGSTFGYKLLTKKEKTAKIFLGAWYRWDVAVIAKAGFDFENFRLSGAYDIGTGAFGKDLKNDTGARMPNAFEIAVSYIGPYKNKSVTTNTYLFNPRF
ncbi:MAG: PorP/SprF family type IX secretion system membrane protein [Chitinophagales bacterium]|nr:PorP/SprF family type IX secretion system membrane protein [Chitinophagales bacterium]